MDRVRERELTSTVSCKSRAKEPSATVAQEAFRQINTNCIDITVSLSLNTFVDSFREKWVQFVYKSKGCGLRVDGVVVKGTGRVAVSSKGRSTPSLVLRNEDRTVTRQV